VDNAKSNSIPSSPGNGRDLLDRITSGVKAPNLKDPTVVLSLLEADQVVAAKQQTRFGARDLSLGLRILLWGLRVYVAVMLVIVVISVVRATHALP
jgi:hypothetical protein